MDKYKGIDLSNECFITTRDGLSIPFKVERLDHNPLTVGPQITGYLYGSPYRRGGFISTRSDRRNVEIKDVIFNDPATIVLWADGSKTIVKCQEGDTYSRETGLALCIAKKCLGNKGNFNEVFKKFIEGYDPRENKKG